MPTTTQTQTLVTVMTDNYTKTHSCTYNDRQSHTPTHVVAMTSQPHKHAHSFSCDMKTTAPTPKQEHTHKLITVQSSEKLLYMFKEMPAVCKT